MSPAAPAAALPLEVPLAPTESARLVDGEIVLLLVKPSMWFVATSSVRVACMGLVVCLGLLAAINDPKVPWNATHAVAAGALIVATRMGWAVIDWWGRVYILTDRRVIAVGGVLPQRHDELPLGQAECADAGATGAERMVGVGHVAIRRARRAPIAVLWSGVRQPVACRTEIERARRRYAR